MPPLNPMINEMNSMREYWSLRADPIFRGKGIPQGDGRLVLVLPGLFANDVYLNPMRGWLKQIGYTALPSSLSLNVGCPQRLLDKVERTLHSRGGQGPIAIIGHSRGGMLGKALAVRLGARCSHLIALGSPVGAMWNIKPDALEQMAMNATSDIAAPQVSAAARRAMKLMDPHCNFPICECEYVDAFCGELNTTTNVTAIYSSDDGVVAPSACPIEGANNIEIRGSHSGLVFNKEAYPHIAAALAN